MKYILSNEYDNPSVNARIMGPNPLKLQETLLKNEDIRGKTVLDLGSGQGVTSLMLAKSYGAKVVALDLWSDPTDNMRFFESQGLTKNDILPLKGDAENIPFPRDYFDAVVCTDSYNYFGRNETYLKEKLLPFVKTGGKVFVSLPGMKKDLHENLPAALLNCWSPEQLDYIHDKTYWKILLEKTDGVSVSISENEDTLSPWQDWVKEDNEYARNDKKAVESGAINYLNFLSIVITKL